MPKNNTLSNIQGSAPIYLVRFETPYKFADYYAENLAEHCVSLRYHELFEDSPIWNCDLYFHEEPDLAPLKAAIQNLSAAINIPAPTLTMHEQENKNWVEEISKSFKPITAGKFYIYSEFSEPARALVNIRINPGMAFGTGQHETTYLCLEALCYLGTTQKFENILDLGCGSGILAIAANHLWDAKVTAADNDPIAVKVAKENFEFNLHTILPSIVSEGFAKIKEQKFDLIIANILMNPLLDMAEDMAKYGSKYMVLSGFKTDQVDEIIKKYSALGFNEVKQLEKNGWISLILAGQVA